MKKLIRLLPFLSMLALLSVAANAVSVRTNDSQMFLNASPTRNYVKNSGCERNVNNITVTGNAPTVNTTTPLEGDGDCAIDAGNATSTYDFVLDTFQKGLFGQNCEARFKYVGDASLYSAVVRQGSNDITTALTLLNSTTNPQQVSINFPCGDGSTATVIRIQRVSGDPAAIKVDGVYGGLATNLSSSYALTDWASYTPAAIQGAGTFTSSQLQWRLLGDSIQIRGNFTTGTVAASEAQLPLPTGYTTADTGKIPATQLAGVFENNNTGTQQIFTVIVSPSVTYLNFGLKDGSTAPLTKLNGNVVWASTTVVTIPTVTIPILNGTNGALTVNPGQTAWKVDANISGANPSLGVASVSTYTGIENGSLTLTNNTGTGNIAAQIPCSGANAPTGTTCGAGNESVGVAFTPLGPFPQDVLACVSFSHDINAVAASTAVTTFQIVETPTNAQTISQEGKTRIATGLGTTAETLWPVRNCGIFTFSAPGQRALRLMFEQAVTGTPTVSQINADAAGTRGQYDIHWEVYPLATTFQTPLLAGSVSSNSTGLERVERVSFAGNSTMNSNCSASPCTIAAQSGSWLSSVSRTSTGLYVLNIASGIFSAQPTCTSQTDNGLSTTFACEQLYNGGSATAVTIKSFNASHTITDGGCHVICMGPR